MVGSNAWTPCLPCHPDTTHGQGGTVVSRANVQVVMQAAYDVKAGPAASVTGGEEIYPAEFEYIWLKDAHIEPCKGCFICFPNGEDKCPSRNDDIAAIVQKMLDADGVIFASPVYSWNVSALMKTFIDRISYTGHRPRFAGKKAFFLVTTGMMRANEVLKYMKKAAWAWGFECTGMVGLITPNGIVPRYRAEMNTKLLRKAAKQFSAGLRRKQKGPGILDIMLFHGGKGAMSQLENNR